jgi:hypothetical protein
MSLKYENLMPIADVVDLIMDTYASGRVPRLAENQWYKCP